MRRFALLVLVSILLSGCRSGDVALARAKFDAPLRQKSEQLLDAHQRETLSLLGKCSSELDDAMKRAISGAGATLTSATGDVFTARAPSEHLLSLARLSFVTQLQLSQMSQPTHP